MLTNYKKYLITVALLFIAVSAVPVKSFASTGSESYWDKGRNFATKICFNSSCSDNNTYNGWSTVVISTGAYMDKASGSGAERIRVWSRTGTIRHMYPSNDWIIGAERAEATFESIDNIPSGIIVTGTTPGTKLQNYTISPLVYTILGYFNKYTGLV